MSEKTTSDRWIKCISTQGNIRGVAIQATQLIRSMTEIHQLEGMGARGLGEAVLGALFLASYCKPGERMNLNIQGEGYFKQALVDAYPDATVRGYVVERALSPEAIKAMEEQGIGPWGQGMLSVLRSKGGEGKQPYVGTVPLLTGHLAKDLTFYWLQSEQIPSAVGIAVNLDEKGQVAAAGGFLIQALPGASSEEVKAIERQIHEIHSLAAEINKSENPVHLLARIFENTAFIIVEEKPIRFQCNCSWERVERALSLIGIDELRTLVREEDKPMVRCDFCSKEYEVDESLVEKIVNKRANT